ncbi:N-acetylmuramoyl-L-alanine amidase [Leptolyngbya sp. FACHB-261]|uniref:hormogonium tapered terminus morphoprotein TftA n=1 Tax=Leptolyngbya sp. FACHB-261 TaxID=2692806 RepID=UPI001687E4BB|nr:N-acetylmuramoyl-L-alanine amidase [Leptolyngbya sp. FACHB-261]MBD2104432.1 N-acetylmuramoyl-L-alanine amidase [Leptolyngbya sp. FACHB-261]
MAQIFISAGHGGLENGRRDPGFIVAGLVEADILIQIRDLLAEQLRERKLPFQSVPDNLSQAQSIAWINARGNREDIALEIHLDSFANTMARGITAYYIVNNAERRRQAETLVTKVLQRIPTLPDRGAQPDTNTALGQLDFCRQTVPGAVLVELGFLTNAEDRTLIQNRRRDYALGLADGLQTLLVGTSPSPAPQNPTPQTPTTPQAPTSTPGATQPYPEITISLNGRIYGERGVIASGNAYLPVDLVDQLKLGLSQSSNIRRITYRGITYMRAVDLREFNIAVSWDATTRTLSLRSLTGLCPGQFDQINSSGVTTEVQLKLFLKNSNDKALGRYDELPKLYRQEASIEGINYDIAFAQMCVETGFLKFEGDVKPEQNNFAGLGGVGSGAQTASFETQTLGVRAHIQHLKAYANTAPLVQELVDPRFGFVTRGIAPLVDQLSGRWAADPNYGTRIKAVLRQLYESAGIL